MVGLFSFLLFASTIAFTAAVVLLIVRGVKKRPKKPFATMAAASVALFLVSFVGIGVTYHPTPEQIAEQERIAAERAEEKAAQQAEQEQQKAEEAARREAEEAAQRENKEGDQQESISVSATEEKSPTSAETPKDDTQQPAENTGSDHTKTRDSTSVSATEKESPSSPEQPNPKNDVRQSTKNTEQKPSVSSAKSEQPERPSAPPEPEETAPVESEPDFISEHRTDIVVSAKMVLDEFITNYKIPLATQLWTIAKFDNEGAIAAMADITEKSMDATVTAIVVLTPVVENERMTGATPHFVLVGDTVYGDDGYCDDVFAILEGIGNNQ